MRDYFLVYATAGRKYVWFSVFMQYFMGLVMCLERDFIIIFQLSFVVFFKERNFAWLKKVFCSTSKSCA